MQPRSVLTENQNHGNYPEQCCRELFHLTVGALVRFIWSYFLEIDEVCLDYAMLELLMEALINRTWTEWNTWGLNYSMRHHCFCPVALWVVTISSMYYSCLRSKLTSAVHGEKSIVTTLSFWKYNSCLCLFVVEPQQSFRLSNSAVTVTYCCQEIN